MENVVILGASAKEERYSYKAQQMLSERGYNLYPVNPCGGEVLGVECFRSVDEIKDDVNTVTVYVAPKRLAAIVDDIIQLKPQRVIFNPGTESDEIMKEIEKSGINTVQACTLVMLSTNQF